MTPLESQLLDEYAGLIADLTFLGRYEEADAWAALAMQDRAEMD